MRVALIHDWLVSSGGAERVLDALVQLFPGAPVYTSVCDNSALPKSLKAAEIRTSFIQNLPMSRKKYRDYLPLMPFAFESFDLRGFDLTISSSHACAKGVRPQKGSLHLCYCHTPMRYAYDMYDEYMRYEEIGPVKRLLIPPVMAAMRKWDISSSKRVDHFIANSMFVAERIKKYYGRQSEVIYPPVNTDRFRVLSEKQNYFMVISRLVPQKRTDIVIKAFNDLGYPLKIIGKGRDLDKLKSMAGPNIEFLGYQSDERVSSLMSGAKALIFASKEDFGIVPVEAQAAGCPVIVYSGGGAKEAVIPGKTGLIFENQTAEAVIDAVRTLERTAFDSEFLRQHAMQFDKRVFKEKMASYINAKIKAHQDKIRK